MIHRVLRYSMFFQAEDGIRYKLVTELPTCSLFFQAEDGIRDKLVTGVQTCAFFFQAEDGIRDKLVTGVQTCALPISQHGAEHPRHHVRLGVGERGFRLARVEPDAVAVSALVDLDAVPLTRDQVVAALRALHVM